MNVINRILLFEFFATLQHFFLQKWKHNDVVISSVNIFRGDRGPLEDKLLPVAFFCFGLNFEIFAKN